jgi:4-diphosphocytidyl-2-C-methyl-D-erythritol kinase
VSAAPAYAKINLALVVGGRRDDGKHEVVTVLQRIDLHDTITVDRADALVIEGFAEDTIVHAALESLANAAGREPGWRVHVEKRIPVAAGLGGGSSDAATALSLANASLHHPLSREELHGLAARIGADVPFFLRPGAQLGRGDGTELEAVALPAAYSVVLVFPTADAKASTGAVYAEFDARRGEDGFTDRAAALAGALLAACAAPDLAALPRNDLASSPLTAELEAAGAFRADVSGAGPTVYGLFEEHDAAVQAADALSKAGRTLVTRPVEAGDPA